MSSRIRIVSATRESQSTFAATALGRSLAPYPKGMFDLRLFEKNTRGLSTVYNIAIAEAATDPAILMFVHDDVFLIDFYWVDQVVRGLTQYDVIGLAGNKRRLPRQPSWAHNEKMEFDLREHLTGIVGHGIGSPPNSIMFYGPPGQEVKLLDGLLLAARSQTLHSRGLRFDERFDFHFYDLDFCRQAELLGMKMGTWPLSVIHQSAGSYNQVWRAAYTKYLDKWKE
jgi:GT2 family glycosyltransferase